MIKCVKVLRESANGNDEHSSLLVLAMKAWLGLGRHGEAKKELRGMVIDKGISERVWVSTMEAKRCGSLDLINVKYWMVGIFYLVLFEMIFCYFMYMCILKLRD